MPTTRKPIPTQATLLSLSEDALRRALAHVPLQHHGALAQTCKRLRAVKQATRFRRERANSGCEESVLIVTGCLLYTSPSPRDATLSRMPSSA